MGAHSNQCLCMLLWGKSMGCTVCQGKLFKYIKHRYMVHLLIQANRMQTKVIFGDICLY